MKCTSNVFRASVASVATLLLTTASSFGHGGGGDIALFTNHNQNKVDVGFAVLDDSDISQEEFDPNVGVFQAVLIPNEPDAFEPWTYGTEEPGFDSEEALPRLKAVSANTLELWYWDGNGPVALQPASELGITGGYPPLGTITSNDGGYHAHPLFGVVGDTVPDGIYIAKVTISVDTLEDSNPYYLVTLKDESLYTGNPLQDAQNGVEVGEAVRAYLENPSSGAPEVFGTDYTFYANAVAFARTLPVPEPTTAVLLAIGLAARWMTQRRRAK